MNGAVCSHCPNGASTRTPRLVALAGFHEGRRGLVAALAATCGAKQILVSNPKVNVS